MSTNALEAAHAIESLAVVDDTGLIDFGSIEIYANVLRCTEDEADNLIDEGLEILVSEGKVISNAYGDYYMAKDRKEWEEREREEIEDWENYQHDVMVSYHQNIWG